jgi:hypothetical protein
MSGATASDRHRPIPVTVIAVLLVIAAVAAIVGGVALSIPAEEGALGDLQTRLGMRFEEEVAEAEEEEGGTSAWQILLTAIVLAVLGILIARGMWTMQNWARTAVILLLLLVGLYYGVSIVFKAAAEIFGGEQIVPVGTILKIALTVLFHVAIRGIIPGAIILHIGHARVTL